MNLFDWIDCLRDGFHDYAVNLRLWWNVVSRQSPYEYQIVTFWYWLNYPYGGN